MCGPTTCPYKKAICMVKNVVEVTHYHWGDKMDKKYESLYTLIDQDAAANKYYTSLPGYVQEQISQRADSVNSLASLKDYAENLLRGDD